MQCHMAETKMSAFVTYNLQRDRGTLHTVVSCFNTSCPFSCTCSCCSFFFFMETVSPNSRAITTCTNVTRHITAKSFHQANVMQCGRGNGQNKDTNLDQTRSSCDKTDGGEHLGQRFPRLFNITAETNLNASQLTPQCYTE